MGSAGASVALTPAVVMYAVAAVLIHVAVQNTVSTQTHTHAYYTCCTYSQAEKKKTFRFAFSVYEAGKMAKSGQPPQIAMYQPYYVPGVPVVSVVPPVAPSIIEPKLSTVPRSADNNIAGGKTKIQQHM